MEPKGAAIIPILIGGAVLGIGFGLTGHCPSTGLACAAAGRVDALITVVGMFAGTLVYLLLEPLVMPGLNSAMNYGKVTLPSVTGTNAASWVLPIIGAGMGVLWMTRSRGR